MHSNEPESNRLAVQPKELKFEVLTNVLDARAAETVGRRAFKAPAKLHAINGRSVKVVDNDDDDGQRRIEGKTSNRPLPTEVSCRTNKRRKRMSTRFEFNAGEARRVGKPKSYTRLHSLPPLDPDGQKNLHIEGNSYLSMDASQAASTLNHLSDCVAVERRLKEQLEEARCARLQAFRGVIRIYLNSIFDASEGRFARAVPDTLALARCSVVTNTLVTTIQSYVRFYQSKQLSYTLQSVQRMQHSAEVDYNSTFSLRSVRKSSFDSSSEDSGSLHDVLDEQEINKLKQLYFDYFDCEVISIGSPLSSKGMYPSQAPLQCSTNSATVDSIVSPSRFETAASTTM